MTMNSSGPISLGGTTAGQSIAVENGGPGTAQISLNCTAVRTLAGVPSGAIIMPTNFYGKSNTVILNITISASTQNYCVYSAVSSNPSYVAGKTQATITINPGVNIGSSSTGSYAMLVPASFNPADTVTIVNNGYIVGAGGSGGAGTPTTGSPGNSGGNALYVNRPTTVTNNGTVGAGGGGGGAGGAAASNTARNRQTFGGTGGSGGAGYNAGSGGAAGPGSYWPGFCGNSGSLTCGGAAVGPHTTCGIGGGGGGAGGSLGNSGGSGSSGFGYPIGYGGGSGAASANYITGNPFVTWPATGTRLGGVA